MLGTGTVRVQTVSELLHYLSTPLSCLASAVMERGTGGQVFRSSTKNRGRRTACDSAEAYGWPKGDPSWSGALHKAENKKAENKKAENQKAENQEAENKKTAMNGNGFIRPVNQLSAALEICFIQRHRCNRKINENAYVLFHLVY